MTNFDIFTATPQFESFASVAISAERILHIDPSACVLNCRRAMEFAVKWMYSVDKALVMPYQDTCPPPARCAPTRWRSGRRSGPHRPAV